MKQISDQLFRDLIAWHLGGLQDAERQARIEKSLSDKLDRAAAREVYRDFLLDKQRRQR